MNDVAVEALYELAGDLGLHPSLLKDIERLSGSSDFVYKNIRRQFALRMKGVKDPLKEGDLVIHRDTASLASDSMGGVPYVEVYKMDPKGIPFVRDYAEGLYPILLHWDLLLTEGEEK